MPTNNFNVGRDITLTIVTTSGPLNFNLLTSFRSKQDSTEQRIKGIDGVTRPVRFFDGWSGGFSIDRQDSTVDDYFSQLEANYYAGVNEQAASITETVTEVSGAVTQYRYVGVLLKLDDAGTWEGDKTVKQSISFMASRRMKIA